MTIIETEIQTRPVTPSPAQVDETGQVLLRAADIIRKNGWAGAFQYGWHGVPRCILGAVDEAAGTHMPSPASRRLRKSLGGNPVAWNNEPGRTQEQVVEALTRAAYGL